MSDTFLMSLEKIQPSQLYVSRTKLDRVMKWLEPGSHKHLEPIPIKELDGEVICTDGHTRGLALFLAGYQEVEVVWETEDLDWDEYAVCVRWCKEEGIRTIPDLRNRVISHSQYRILWYDRCRAMQENLAAERSQRRSLSTAGGQRLESE